MRRNRSARRRSQITRRLTLATIAAALWLPAAGAHAQTNLEGWHAFGQTWLVWTDDQTFTSNETYAIYRSSEPIASLGGVEVIGRIFPQDWQAERLKIADPAALWSIPDGSGGTRALTAQEALFVYTPHEASDEYFAVVKHGATAVGGANTAGPIAQTTDTVQCHPVLTGMNAQHPFTVYAHWIDGRDDSESGRPDYPVMGNAGFNGTAHLFAVVNPTGALPPGPVPAVLALHGGTGNFWNFRPLIDVFFEMSFDVPDGLHVYVDDGLFVSKAAQNPVVVSENSRWFGYWEDYDRFTAPAFTSSIPQDALIVNYTQRRLDFVIQWLIENLNVEAERVSMWGISMGGAGTYFYARWRPEALSAGHSMVPPFAGGGNPFNRFMQGSIAQNSTTNLPGGIGMTDWYWPTSAISDDDLPFLRFTAGINDLADWTGWDNKVVAFGEMSDLRWGAHTYWDERMHGPSDGGWFAAHWGFSPRLDPGDLTRYRSDQSFPATSNVDHDPAPGRQPEIGDAVEPANGDPWGTWGGYFDWETQTIVDEPDQWAATIFLVHDTAFADDEAPTDQATADVTVRRAQSFRPMQGTDLFWRLTRLSDGRDLQAGRIVVSESGEVTAEGLTFLKEPLRLTIQIPSALQEDWSRLP